MIFSGSFGRGWIALLGLGILLYALPLGAQNAPPQPASSIGKTSATTPFQIQFKPPVRYRRKGTANLFTDRPLLAVGKIKQIDSATSTVVVAIDRDKSSMPHILEYRAKNLGLLERVRDREFPPQRAFGIPGNALLIDARPNPDKPQTRAATGKIREDKQRIPFSAFKPGDLVGVLYRLNMDPSQPPLVKNLSLEDPNRKDFNVDNNPLGGKIINRKLQQKGRRISATTRTADQPTSR